MINNNGRDMEILAAYIEVRNKEREKARKKNECQYCGKNKNWCMC